MFVRLPYFTLLRNFIAYHRIRIIAVDETWLSKSVDSNSINIPNYLLFRSDRIGSCGGGVALYIDDLLPCSPILALLGQTSLSMSWVLYFRCEHIAIICIYRPLCSPIADLHHLESCMYFIAVDGSLRTISAILVVSLLP